MNISSRADVGVPSGRACVSTRPAFESHEAIPDSLRLIPHGHMKISVQVQSDHLERISKVRKPIIAVAELIWNGLDADATEVRAEFDHNALGALERIRVIDNGSGLRRSADRARNSGRSRSRSQNCQRRQPALRS